MDRIVRTWFYVFVKILPEKRADLTRFMMQTWDGALLLAV